MLLTKKYNNRLKSNWQLAVSFQKIFIALVLIFFAINAFAQVNVSSCPTTYKRNNGNGQASSAAGNFFPYPQNNPVANNVVGTPYQNVNLDPATKQGSWNFTWNSATPIDDLPVVTRCWISTGSSTPAVLSPIIFGPPPPPNANGNKYNADYAFYVQNMPNIGVVTFEFTDPETGEVLFYCTVDISTGAPAPQPPLGCMPTITSQPNNLTLCAADSAMFSVQATGANSYQWQSSANGASNWTNVNNGGDFSGANTNTLVIKNPILYSGIYYRVVLGGAIGCGSINSRVVRLIANPNPTATFAVPSLCGIASQYIAINLTGTAPWTVTYANGGNVITQTNITSSPFFIAVNGGDTFEVTQVSDLYCLNSAPSGNNTFILNPIPTITPTNVSVCIGDSSFALNYTTTGNPNQYTLSSGIRVLPGFNNISSAVLGTSPMIFSIPQNTARGTYDFNISVADSITGCISQTIAFTVTINALPLVSASVVSSPICEGSTATLTAAPSNLVSFAWTISPSPIILSTSMNYSPVVTTPTTFTLIGTDSRGCSDMASVTVNTMPGPAITITPSSDTICIGNSTLLTASGGNTYTWSPPTGLSSTTGDQVIASPTQTTTYTVVSSNISGCELNTTVTVFVNTTPISVSPSSTICAGNTATLNASGGVSYTWYPQTNLFTEASATIPYTGTSLSTVYAKPTTTTTYFVQGITASGCSGIASTTVTLATPPINTGNSTPPNLVFCTQGVSSFPLNVQVTEAVVSATWSYSVNGTSYTSYTGVVNPTGVRLTPSSIGTAPNITYRTTLSNYGNSGYKGPRYHRLTIVTATCTYIYNILVTDTKGTNPTPPPVPEPSNSVICSGDFGILSIGVLQPGSSAQWQSSPNNSTWTNINGATSNTYTTPALYANTYYRIVFNNNTGNCGSLSSPALITVVSALGANTITPTTSCSDGITQNVLTGSAITNGIYQWQYSTTSSTSGFTNIFGATNQNYTLSTTVVPATTWFRRAATNGTCFVDTSDAVAVYPPITGNSISATNTEYCNDTAPSIFLSGTIPNGGSGLYSYQWQYSTDGISYNNITSGGTSQNYTTTPQNQSFWYRRVTNSGGCEGEISNVVLVEVNSNPVITLTPSATICSGNEVILTASGANSYAWSPADYLSGTTGSTVITIPLTSTTYTVTGTDMNQCTASASTSLTVFDSPLNPTLSDSLQTICIGSSVDLTSMVTSPDSVDWFTVPEANPLYRLDSPQNISSAGTYYAFAKSGNCYSPEHKTFTIIVDDVNTAPLNNLLSLCAPETANLKTIEPAANPGTTLQWHNASSNIGAGTIVNDPTAVGNGTYYLYAYSTVGNCYGNTSTAVTVIINQIDTPVITHKSVNLCAPNEVDLYDYVIPQGTEVYNWYVTNNPTASNLVPSPTQVNTSGTYYVYSTNTSGCYSAPSTLNVTFNPSPTASLSSPAPFCDNESRNIIVTTNATNPTFQWQVSNDAGANYTDLTNTTPYSGVNTATLDISSTTNITGDYYRVIVTSDIGCETVSYAAVLLGETTPTITSTPRDTAVEEGNNAYFDVNLNGVISSTIQWQISTDGGLTFQNLTDSSVFSGVNSAVLYVNNAPMSLDNSLYRIVVYTSCSTVIAAPAMLNVSSNSGISLPVNWLSFHVRKKSENAELLWQTAMEFDSKDYVIYHSTNATKWDSVGVVAAAGYSTQVRSYSFLHTNTARGINYYKIKQRDIDGGKTYSNIQSINFDGDDKPYIEVYPNPSVNGYLNVVGNESSVANIYNTIGAKVLSSYIQPGKSAIDVSTLASGLYYIKTDNSSIPFLVKR